MKTTIVSDLHAGIEGAWLPPDGCSRFEAFCSYLKTDRLILAGDVFDPWYCRHDRTPPTLIELLGEPIPKRVIAAICGLPGHTEVHYVRGNHDCQMSGAVLEQFMPRAKWCGDAFVDGSLYVAHGSELAMFCADDPQVPNRLPLGYWMTRVASTADAKVGGHTPTRQEILASLIDAGQERSGLPGALLHAIAAHAGIGEDEPILMPVDLWGGVSTTLRDLENVYPGLVWAWERRNGPLGVAFGLAAELGHLEAAASMQFGLGAHTVVLGHTHEPVLQHLPFGRIYANSGAICRDPASWVEIEDGEVVLATPPAA